MALPNEQSESAPLPRPELNPLLNPLLAENMGRWAEVYFTAAPEKREEAVVELLRELEAGGSGAEIAAKSHMRPFEDRDFPAPDFSVGDFAREDRQSRAHCHACGHDNPATHQFCGMCGEKLSPEDVASQSEDLRYTAHAAGRGSRSMFGDSFLRNGSDRASGATSGVEREVAPTEPYGQDEASDELSRLRKISTGSSSNTSDFDWDLESSPSGQRHLYVAAGLIVVVLALVYLAWHGSRASQNVHQASSTPPVALNEPAPAPPANADAPDAAALRAQTTAATPTVKPATDGAENARTQGAARSVLERAIGHDRRGRGRQPHALRDGNPRRHRWRRGGPVRA